MTSVYYVKAAKAVFLRYVEAIRKNRYFIRKRSFEAVEVQKT